MPRLLPLVSCAAAPGLGHRTGRNVMKKKRVPMTVIWPIWSNADSRCADTRGAGRQSGRALRLRKRTNAFAEICADFTLTVCMDRRDAARPDALTGDWAVHQ